MSADRLTAIVYPRQIPYSARDFSSGVAVPTGAPQLRRFNALACLTAFSAPLWRKALLTECLTA